MARVCWGYPTSMELMGVWLVSTRKASSFELALAMGRPKTHSNHSKLFKHQIIPHTEAHFQQ